MKFELATSEHDADVVVVVRGELDIATAPQFVEAVEGARRLGPERRLVLDLTDTEFLDSTGVRAIANVARVGDGGHVALVCPSSNTAVVRVMDLTGFSALLPRHETLAELGLDGGTGWSG